jgi:hypothetical protein
LILVSLTKLECNWEEIVGIFSYTVSFEDHNCDSCQAFFTFDLPLTVTLDRNIRPNKVARFRVGWLGKKIMSETRHVAFYFEQK